MPDRDTTIRKAGWILALIAITEGTWVAFNGISNRPRFFRFLGFAAGRGGNALGWILAAVVTVIFIALSSRLPSVRANLFRLSGLKLLALAVAVAAGVCEEAIFRKVLMDALAAHGYGVIVQIAASGLAFGLIHGVWGLMGRSARAAVGATVATGALGSGLAIVFVAAGRSLAPCVAAHFAINAMVEPGLVLAASRREMGSPSGQNA